ncbi:uncharacterized protein E0L32_006208 [Thyridium curvatum]|uniref:3-hydroxyacyl-CoA dehydrogenase n=1 Tax=Thyridium curvatum TaxID=1093900 RepID=A0A507B9M3_9PEZI|nr:uncharacterized protein E0L32_006208 [Thyridium curvatum]TPX13478.1 hypothetical protein E0L32_006208 [Thyridium curvatum]
MSPIDGPKSARESLNVTLIGTGTIGLSFAALHLSRRSGPAVKLTVYDPRPDLEGYIDKTLPDYLRSVWPSDSASRSSEQSRAEAPDVGDLRAAGRIAVASSLADAVQGADIIQEQGPEDVAFKQDIWAKIEPLAPPHALFWSSTSGIPASVQMARMQDKTRLIVLHPFNPPHVMPLLEIVPSPATLSLPHSSIMDQTIEYWKGLGRTPIVVKEEVTGFIANRLSFALFKEAAYLAQRGVCSPQDIDKIVEQSLGPRWAVRGPFWSYHAGGGQDRGLEGFFDKIGSTIQACWDDTGELSLESDGTDKETWATCLSKEVQEIYGHLGPDDLRKRDQALAKVLDITQGSQE